MERIFLFLVVLAWIMCSFLGVACGDDYATAHKALSKDDGLMVVYFYTTTCPNCPEARRLIAHSAGKLLRKLEKDNDLSGKYSAIVQVNLEDDLNLTAVLFPDCNEIAIPQVHVWIKRNGSWLPRQTYTGVPEIRELVK